MAVFTLLHTSSCLAANAEAKRMPRFCNRQIVQIVTARPRLMQRTSPLQEEAPRKEAASGEEPIVASPEKKQRIGSPERSPEDGEKPQADQKQAEPQHPAQEDPKAEDDKDQAEPLQTNRKHVKPQQPQQEAPDAETHEDQAKPQQPQQPQHEDHKAKQQPQQQQLKPQAGQDASDEAKPANGMPAFPTPAEAAGAEVQQPVGEVTRLEDVTGVQQVRSLVYKRCTAVHAANAQAAASEPLRAPHMLMVFVNC